MIARQIAKALNVGYFDHDLIAAIAKEAHVDQHIVEFLDEQARSAMRAAWLRSMFASQPLVKDTYRRILVGVVLGIMHTGGVILGRGANFILEQHPIFRLRVVSSPQTGAKRLANAPEMSYDMALAYVLETNRTRSDFIKGLCKRNIENVLGYDFILNTDRIDVNKAAEVALEGIRRYQFTELSRQTSSTPGSATH